jgi:hypothetical protein
MMPRMEVEDMIDATLAKLPIEKALAKLPMEPMDRADPTDPIDRTEFFEPMDKMEFSERKLQRDEVDTMRASHAYLTGESPGMRRLLITDTLALCLGKARCAVERR